MGLKQIVPGTGQSGEVADPVSQEILDQIGLVANDAKVIAQDAKVESVAAAAAADAATAVADGYSDAIDLATIKSEEAKSAADAAAAAAGVASGKADAVTATAASADTKANTAISTANGAAGKADAAKATADGLDGRVTAVEVEVDAATAAVAGAYTAASTASTKADTALAAAEDATAIAVQYDSRLNDIESTQGGYTQLISEATATANAANATAIAAAATADGLDDAVAAGVAVANTAKTAADSAAALAATASGQAIASLAAITDVNDDIVAATNTANAASVAAAAAAATADAAENLIADIQADVTDHQASIEAHETRLDAQDTTNITTSGRVTALETAVSTTLIDYMSIWGDSRTAQNWNTAGNAATARGYAWWAEALSGRVRLHLKYNFGVSGDTISQLYTRMTADTANASGVKPSQVPPSHAILHIGTNSINAETSLATCMSQLNQCVDWLTSRGHVVYVVSEWPRGQTVNGVAKSILTTAAQKIMYGYAREIRKLTRTKKIKVIDVWPGMGDPASLTCQPRAGYLNNDSLHPSIGAGFLTGKLIAKAMEENNAHKLAFGMGSQDLYDATSNKEGALNDNPMMKGTTGTHGSGSSGVAPTGWTITPSTGLTSVSSNVTVTMPDGTKREALRIVVSGTPDATSASLNLRVPAAIRATPGTMFYGKVADGDTVEAWAEVMVNGVHTNFGNLTCNIAANTSALTQSGGVVTGGTGTPNLDTFTGDIQWPDGLKQDYSAVVRSPEMLVTSAITQFQIEVRAYFLEASVSSSLTFDVLSAGMRKKTALV